MSEQNPESGFCLNFKMTDKQGVETQFTMRAPLLSDWKTAVLARDKVIGDLIGQGWTVGRSSTPASQPQTKPPQGNGHANVDYRDFDATQIVKTFDDSGNMRIKVKGKPFEKFGVPVYEEDFEALGLDLEKLQPGTHEFRHLVRAVLKEDGNPRKIVEVLS